MIIPYIKLIIFIFTTYQTLTESKEIPKLEVGDLKNLGVAFSPYGKKFDDQLQAYHPWNYTFKEIRIMTELVESRFSLITTYSTGYGLQYVNTSWEKTDANALIPRSAAYINKGEDKLILRVLQGIYQNEDKEVENVEIDNAFKIAEDANSIFPGTVDGLIFFNLYQLTESDVENLLEKIEASRPLAKKLNLRLGTRLHHCKDILGGQNYENVIKMINATDFVFCNIFPSPEILHRNVPQVVKIFTDTFLTYKKAIENAKSNIEVYLGEVGWPSRGKSHNSLDDKPNTIQNMAAFWNELAIWSKKENVTVIMFEAFDEPWKVNLNNYEKSNHAGRCGGEQHYGWWKRLDNKVDSHYIEKIYDPKEFFPDDDCVDAKKANKDKTHIIIITVLVVLLGIFIMSFIVFYLVKRIKQTKTEIEQLTELEIQEFLNGMSETDAEHLQEAALQFPYNKDLEMSKAKFIIDKNKVLGSGEFGVVYKADIVGGKSVAIKTVKENNVQAIRNLLAEIKLMSFIGKHPNVISLVGAYTEEIRKGVVFLAVELCELGSMQNYLRENKSKALNVYENETGENSTIERGNAYENVPNVKFGGDNSDKYENMIISQFQLCKWSFDIATGMEYLEEKKVIHADLATRNVLLSSSLEAKITDFGLSRRLYEYQEYVKKNSEPFPWRWMAIESLDKMKFSHKSDVWSFGVTLWEIFSFGDIPFPGLSWDIGFINKLENGLRMQTPKNTPTEIYDLMAKCWNLEPNERPSFTLLKNCLSTIYNKEN